MSARTSLIALAIGLSLPAATTANAQVQMFEDSRQQVQMFESVPSIEQLRNILIPEALPSAPRRIIIPGRMEAPTQQLAKPATLSAPAATSAAQQVGGGQQNAPVVAAAVPNKPAVAKIGEAHAIGVHINFAFNSAEIPSDAMPYLNAIADLLRQERSLALEVEGHTDAVGSDDYNLELSKMRADSVKTYLTHHGVAAAQLVPVGKGKTEPLVANPYDGRNRRVQFSRITYES